MISNEDIESYLVRTEQAYDPVEEGLWVIDDPHGKIVIHHAPPIIVFRVKLMDVPGGTPTALYRRLLELNASEMITAAYGVEEGAVVAVASLQSENLDYNELQGALDSISLAMTEHRDELVRLATA